MQKLSWFRAFVVGATALITACNDVAGEARDLTVRVWVIGTEAPTFHTAPDSTLWISCEAYLAAQATGTGAAHWQGATMRYFNNAAPAVPFDSTVLSATEMGASWSDEPFNAGQTLHAITPVVANAPFHVTIEFHYRTDQGKDKNASATINCGERPGESTPLPALPTFSVVPNDTDVEPGGLLTVTYSASSPLGLWQTVVAVSGPCQFKRQFTEKLELSVQRTIAVRLPSSCTLGAVPRVGVAATDGRMQTTARSLQLSPLVDHTRPSIRTGIVHAGTAEELHTLAGSVFVGQTLWIDVIASDNHKLHSITWERPDKALRDSVLVTDSMLTRTLTFQATEDMIGPFEVRYHARDAVGLVSDTVSAAPGAFRIYPTIARPERNERMYGVIWPRQFVLDDTRNALYVEDWDGNVYRKPLDSFDSAGEQPLEMPNVRGLEISPGGDSLLTVVPGLRSLAIVDLRTSPGRTSYLKLDSLAADAEATVHDLRAVNGGRVFILIRTMAHGNRLLEVSLATGAQRWHDEVGTDLMEYMLRTPDHSKLFVSNGICVRRFDSAVGTFGGCIPRPGSLPTTSDLTGQTLAAGDSIYDGSLNLIRRVTTPSSVAITRPVLTPDGRDLFYLVGNAGLVRSDVISGQLMDRSTFVHYSNAPGDIFITRDGTRVVSFRDAVGSDGKVITVITVR